VILSVWANWMLTVLTIVVTYVLLPYNIHLLGREAYGTWILITSITGYLGLLALGAPMATLRYIARYAAEKDEVRLNQAVGTFAGLFLAVGFASIVIGTGLLFVFDAVYHVPPELIGPARLAFALVILNVGAGFIQQLPYGIMAAYGDFPLRNAIMGSAVLLRLCGNLLLLWLWPTITVLAVVNLLVTAFEMTVCWMLVHRKYPHLQIRLRHFDWSMLRTILSFSLFVLVLSMGAQLSYQTDSLVIGGYLELSEIPRYTVANSLTVYLMEFVAAIAVVVMPTATRLHTGGDRDGMRNLFLKWSKITFSLSLLAGSFLIVLGPRFLAWWLGPDFEGPSGRVLRILMLSYLIFLPARGVAQPILMGIGKPAHPSIAFVIAGLLNVVLSLLWVQPFGLDGVAWGTSIPNILLGLSVLYFTCRELELPVGVYLRHVLWRPVLGSAPCFAFLWWVLTQFDVHGLPSLVASGLGVTGVFAVVWILFVYRGDPHVDLKAWLSARLPFGARTA
jgi:O-antigen/teichoic acid export membrane protein